MHDLIHEGVYVLHEGMHMLFCETCTSSMLNEDVYVLNEDVYVLNEDEDVVSLLARPPPQSDLR